MRALVQRVTRARVTVRDQAGNPVEVAAIGPGLVGLVGVTHGDDEETARRLADKVWNLRVFDDATGAMNVSVAEAGGALCVVSQFTLYGSTARGRRPSWAEAARPDHAEPLVAGFVAALVDRGGSVATGRFGAMMEVELVNDGPVTLMVEVLSTAG